MKGGTAMPGDRFYHTPAWRALRERILKRDHFYCQPCKRAGRFFVPANTVHHIIPRDLAPELEMDAGNLEAICSGCHNKEHPEKAFRRAPGRLSHRRGVRVIKM
jgi:5-methylcytosine-specific restriction endonuclease McrA